jgi:hypothetical protein
MVKDSAASWTTQDKLDLLNFLAEHASAAGDGGNFKSTTFQAATAVLNQNPVKGGVKTWKACSNKYSAVSFVVYLQIFGQRSINSAIAFFGPFRPSRTSLAGPGVTKQVPPSPSIWRMHGRPLSRSTRK